MKNQRMIGIIMSYLSAGISIITTFIYTPLIVNMLGSGSYGRYSWALSIVSYLSLLQLGLNVTFTRFYSRLIVEKDEQGMRRMNGLFMSVYLFLSLVALIYGFFLIRYCDVIMIKGLSDATVASVKNLMWIMVLNVALTFPFSLFQSNIVVREQYFFARLIEILKHVFNPLLGIPLMLLGFGNYALAWATTLITLGTGIAYMVFCFKKLHIGFEFRGFDWQILKQILSFTSFVFLSSAINQVNWSVDRMILGKISGDTAVTAYTLGDNLSMYFLSISTIISDVYAPKVHRLVASGHHDREINHLFRRVARIQFMVLSLIIMGFFALGPCFMMYYAPDTSQVSFDVAMLLFLSMIGPGIQSLALPIQQAKNMHQFRSIVYAFVAIGNVAVSIPLAYFFGPFGAAIGTFLSTIIGNVIIMNIYFNRRLGLDMPRFWRSIISILPSFVPCALICILARYIGHIDTFWKMIPWGLLIVLSYGICVLKWGMNREEKRAILALINKMEARKKKQHG